MEVGMGFWASKTLLAAVKLGLFTLLAEKHRSAREIQEELDLHERSLFDFLDALVALGFLERDGFKEDATYGNAPVSDRFLDRNKEGYVGGMLEMANDRLYPFWGNLEEKKELIRKSHDSLRDGGALIAIENVIDDDRSQNEFGLLPIREKVRK